MKFESAEGPQNGDLKLPAPTCPIQREIGDGQLEWIMNHRLFSQMGDGISSGQVLPTLRKREVHFYEGGARLFRFTTSGVLTHAAYIDDEGDGEREVGKVESITAEYIRKRAVPHRTNKQPDSELAAVHSLFPCFAITRTAHRPGELALIDVEARFAADAAGDPILPAKMIDLVFLLPDRRLLFVEAKCVGNPAVRSTKTAAVVRQVEDYQRHIAREGVLDALNRSLEAQSYLVKRDLGQSGGIFPRVPVLVLDPTKQGLSRRSNDTWLRNALAYSGDSKASSADTIVIDGMVRPDVAIRNFVAGLHC
jgi:hypothetical protein